MGLFSKAKAEREARERELRLKQTRTWPDALRIQSRDTSALCQDRLNKYNGMVSYDVISMNKKENMFRQLSETSMLEGKVDAVVENIVRGGKG